jgi:hypothetical protein
VLDDLLEKAFSQDFGHGSVAATGLTQPETAIIAAAPAPSRRVQKELGTILVFEWVIRLTSFSHKRA